MLFRSCLDFELNAPFGPDDDDQGEVDPVLLRALAAPDVSGAWMLPNLETISVTGDMEDASGHALCALVSARSALMEWWIPTCH